LAILLHLLLENFIDLFFVYVSFAILILLLFSLLNQRERLDRNRDALGLLMLWQCFILDNLRVLLFIFVDFFMFLLTNLLILPFTFSVILLCFWFLILLFSQYIFWSYILEARHSLILFLWFFFLDYLLKIDLKFVQAVKTIWHQLFNDFIFQNVLLCCFKFKLLDGIMFRRFNLLIFLH